MFDSPWQELSSSKTENKENDLCSLVENILFVVMWRGVNIHSKNCWKVLNFNVKIILKYHCNGFKIFRNVVKLWHA